MGLVVQIEVAPGVHAFGVLATIHRSEWHVHVNEVPRLTAFHYDDLVAVAAAEDAASQSHRFLRVVERGSHQPSLRVTHQLTNLDEIDHWLDGLEKLGWATRDDEGGLVWVAAPAGVDACAVLAAFSWIAEVS